MMDWALAFVAAVIVVTATVWLVYVVLPVVAVTYG